jgi:uncharacterized protein YjbI with pentapeptide repeats
MANDEHLRILRQGVLAWNQWRKANHVEADVSVAIFGGADLREYLRRADLRGADLRGAELSGLSLREAKLSGTNFSLADLSGADLSRAGLGGANLREANLREANLREADLRGADLRGANLTWANLIEADLRGADLTESIMPDGRVWEEYQRDHLAGLCQTPEIRAKAIAAWGGHSWKDCPMHAAHGVCRATTIEMAAWVALYDSGLLECPL